MYIHSYESMTAQLWYNFSEPLVEVERVDNWPLTTMHVLSCCNLRQERKQTNRKQTSSRGLPTQLPLSKGKFLGIFQFGACVYRAKWKMISYYLLQVSWGCLHFLGSFVRVMPATVSISKFSGRLAVLAVRIRQFMWIGAMLIMDTKSEHLLL